MKKEQKNSYLGPGYLEQGKLQTLRAVKWREIALN